MTNKIKNKTFEEKIDKVVESLNSKLKDWDTRNIKVELFENQKFFIYKLGSENKKTKNV